MKNFSLLDSEFSFQAPVHPGGKVNVSGKHLIPAGERAIIAIQKNSIEVSVEGLTESGNSEFYYVYLYGTGVEEDFSIDFKLISEALVELPYSVPMYIKGWYCEGPIYFIIDQVESDNSIFVLGSCVSRDTFEYSKDILSLSGYRARTSFANLHCLPLEGASAYDLSGNTSPFQRRMVRGDLTKDALLFSKNSSGRFILVDFIDERLPIRNTANSRYTASPEFLSCNLTIADIGVTDTFSEEYFREFARGWISFLEASERKTVIVNRVFWAHMNDLGETLDNQENILKHNKKLKRLYEIVESLSPYVIFLEYRQSDLIADSRHKWGQAPFHFTSRFYRKQLDQILDIVGETKI